MPRKFYKTRDFYHPAPYSLYGGKSYNLYDLILCKIAIQPQKNRITRTICMGDSLTAAWRQNIIKSEKEIGGSSHEAVRGHSLLETEGRTEDGRAARRGQSGANAEPPGILS